MNYRLHLCIGPLKGNFIYINIFKDMHTHKRCFSMCSRSLGLQRALTQVVFENINRNFHCDPVEDLVTCTCINRGTTYETLTVRFMMGITHYFSVKLWYVAFLLETGAFILSVIKWLPPYSCKKCFSEKQNAFYKTQINDFYKKGNKRPDLPPWLVTLLGLSADAADKFADKMGRDFHRGTLLLK